MTMNVNGGPVPFLFSQVSCQLAATHRQNTRRAFRRIVHPSLSLSPSARREKTTENKVAVQVKRRALWNPTRRAISLLLCCGSPRKAEHKCGERPPRITSTALELAAGVRHCDGEKCDREGQNGNEKKKTGKQEEERGKDSDQDGDAH